MPTGTIRNLSIDDEAAVHRVMTLMSIPGRSREESKVVAYIRDQLQEAGVPSSCMEVDTANQRTPNGGETGNLIVKIPGTKRGSRRLLMAHMDTVPICVGCKPVRDKDAIRSSDTSTGLGGDDRAGIAVVLTTAIELIKQQIPHPPLTLLFAVQEEIGLYGARFVSAKSLGSPKLCFNWDGGDPSFVNIGATGDYGIDIEIGGIASHAGVHPERGVSAITIASLAIADLTQNGWHGLIKKGRSTGTSNVGIISGGEATNVVTPLLKIRAEARSHDPVFRKRIVDAYRKAFQKAVNAVRSADGSKGTLKFDAELKYDSFRLKEDEAVVSLAKQAVTAAGLNPQLNIGNGGLDANWMYAHGLPTVTLGCGQNEIHTVREWLNVPHFLTACRIGLLLGSGQLG